MKVAEATPFEEVLSAGGERIRLLMEDVESQLIEASSGYGAELECSARSTLAAGGKRLRPLLVFICGETRRRLRSREPLVRAAVAVELVHMATLVHDDVIDCASVRRGSPTVFASSGRRAAIATGDFLFSRAFSVLGANADGDQIRVLSDACLALARGELAQRRDAYALDIDVERYLSRCELKTASLFVASCKLGALAAGESASQVDAVGRFGRMAGMAFQILDDVLDVVGAPDQTGKLRGTDLLEGITTLPLILAGEADSSLATLDLRAIDSRERAEEVCDRIAATDALELSRRQAGELMLAAKSALDGNLAPPVSELLRLVSDRILDRDK
jgi:geranylgeranyl pyrophosphate synthase